MEDFQVEYRSTLDRIMLPMVQSYILCFPCDSSQQDSISSVLHKAFKKTIDENPRLGGRVELEDSGRLKLIFSNKAADDERFVVKDLTQNPNIWSLSYAELAKHGAPFALLKSPILSFPCEYQRLISLPICAQANFIPGGCLLYVALHHSLVDGIGADKMLNIWTQNCKVLQNEATEIPTLDWSIPEVLQNSAPQKAEAEKFRKETWLWEAVGLKNPADVNPEPPVSSGEDVVSAVFCASTESLARLKVVSAPTTGFVSSFDVTAALLWRCIMRSREADLDLNDKSIISRLHVAVDLRESLGIPAGYFGNVVFYSITKMPLESLLTQTNHLASKVRSTIAAVRERAHDALKLSFLLGPPSERILDFTHTATHDVVLTSWRDMPFYQMDWGGILGTPQFVRTNLQGFVPGLCVLLQMRTKDEFEVLVNLYPAQLEKLKRDAEFCSYFQFRCK